MEILDTTETSNIQGGRGRRVSLRKAYIYDGILCIYESELFQNVYNVLKSVSKSKTKQNTTNYRI